METTMTQIDIMFRNFQIKKFNNKFMTPTVTMLINADISSLIELKKKANDNENLNTHITITHVVAKAVADVLMKFPILYNFFNGSKIIHNPELVLNIPVDVENHVEYITIHKPDSKTLVEISNEFANELKKINNKEGEFMKYLQRMNEIPFLIKKLHTLISNDTINFMRQYYGNFVISNFGSFNVNSGSLPLSQPMIAGLCIGAISQVISNSVNDHMTIMNLPISISFDHRAIDGAYAGKFLSELKNLLENSEKLFNI
ncbi:2-oxo acid dehydrogenase subunit E2 [Clostridium saccharoperbutylacetonicum]|uniref:2-oxo acid dehydrogenase subunit E2 n=1 Tax=Clostridium saccharoperbutylacetonicum TaxID=36745 RepID=UPI0039EA539B